MSNHLPSATSPPDTVRERLDALLSRWVETVREHTGQWPVVEHDDEWPSPCVLSEPALQQALEPGQSCWRPIARDVDADFSGIEAALETALHSSVKSFYGSFFCNPVSMRAPDGALTLLQAWSERDFDRLLENLIGHAWAQRRAKLPLSAFIAVTDEEDLNLCVNNDTGKVMLERPGELPLREVAPSLLEFLATLEPLPPGSED